jgi:hypothetical protein
MASSSPSPPPPPPSPWSPAGWPAASPPPPLSPDPPSTPTLPLSRCHLPSPGPRARSSRTGCFSARRCLREPPRPANVSTAHHRPRSRTSFVGKARPLRKPLPWTLVVTKVKGNSSPGRGCWSLPPPPAWAASREHGVGLMADARCNYHPRRDAAPQPL